MPTAHIVFVLHIDCSQGEGGGQIVRTALGLSVALGVPVALDGIRAGRKVPGLRPQHRTVVEALAAISSAKASEPALGATSLTFVPGRTVPGSYSFDIGTAGSATLLAHALLLPLSMADAPSCVTLRGGTDVPWSPTVDYYAHVTAPFLSRLSLSASVTCLQRGYYPRGGGTLRLQVAPWKDRRSLGRLSFSEPESVTVSSSSAGLPDRVAQEQAEAAASVLSAYEVEVLLDRTGHGTGSAITVWADAGGFPVGASCIGRKGLPAREVGLAAAKEFLSVLDARAADPHLPDQVLPFMAMADGCSSLPLSEVTSHLTTMQWLVRNVAAIPVTVEGGMLFVG